MPPTSWTPRTSVPTTSWNGRVTTPSVTNTVSPIITGIWNDLSTWTETGKFWNDTGDVTGLTPANWSGRIIP